MISFSTTKNSSGTKSIVFSVPLSSKALVYMSLIIGACNEDKYGVVIVDAGKFLQLWRNAPHNLHYELAYGDTSTWPNDYKYMKAQEGFSRGPNDPVPLADVLYGADLALTSIEQCRYVNFTNGVTRTIWLLTQGCRVFPIKCETPGAEELYGIAAAPEYSLLSVCDLAKMPAHA